MSLLLVAVIGIDGYWPHQRSVYSNVDALTDSQILLSANQAMHLYQGYHQLGLDDALPVLEQQVQQKLQQLRHHFVSIPALASQLDDLQTQWQWIVSNKTSQDGNAQYAAQQALTQELIGLQQNIGTKIVLHENRPLATTQFLRLVIDVTPALLNHLSMLRAYSTHILQQPANAQEYQLKLKIYKSFLEQDMGNLKLGITHLEHSDPALQNLLSKIRDQLVALTLLFNSDYSLDGPDENSEHQAQAWFTLTTQSLDNLYETVQHSLLPALEQRLQQENDQYTLQQWLAVLAFVLSLSGLIGLLLFIGLHSKRKIQKMHDDLVHVQYSEQIYSDIIENLHSSLLIFNPEGVMLAANSAALQLFQFNHKSEIQGQQLTQLVPLTQPNGRSSKEYMDEMTGLTLQKQFHAFECTFVNHQSEPFFAEVQLSQFVVDHRTCLLAEIRDISLQKQVFLQLNISEARTRAILSNLSDAVVMINTEGEIIMVNYSVAHLFGYDEEDELLGQNVSMLMPEPYRSEHDGYLMRHQRNNMKPIIIGRRIEISGQRKDGSIFPIELSVNELLDDLGTTYIGVIRDISDRKAIDEARELALRQAEHLAQAKTDFMANMSHEIRTPLNAIIGLAKIASRNNVPKSVRNTTQKILAAGVHLLDLVNDILDYSKIEAGKMSLDPHPFRLKALIDEVIQMMDLRVHDKELELRLMYASELPEWVFGDALRLKQVLINLLSNAVKFTEMGSVTLTVKHNNEWVEISIEDTGIGMTEEQVGRLFTAFEQADASTTRRFGGTGLGLAISGNLAHLMGGEIQVTSVPNQGSQFTFHLPLPVTEAGVDANVAEPVGSRLQGYRVLAADDSELNRLVLEDALVQEGARVQFAENGQDLLDQFELAGEAAFDLVLMDVQMPVMDGLLATRNLKKQAPNLPVIALTAHVMPEERVRCLDAGMLERITKPIDVEVLVDVIRKLVPIAPVTERLAAQEQTEQTQREQTVQAIHQQINGEVLIDWSAVLKRFSGRQDFIDKLIANTLDGTQTNNIQKLREAVQHQDSDSIKFIAHALKGMAGVFQASSVQTVAQQTEQAAKTDAPEMCALANELADKAEALLNELKHYQDNQAS